MQNNDIISLVKSTTVAIGLIKKGTIIPAVIAGTGFVVDKEGYVMTATHVFERCKEYQKNYAAIKQETQFAMFRTLHKSDLSFDVGVFEKTIDIKFQENVEGLIGPNKIDISIGKLLVNPGDLDVLPIIKSDKMSVSDKVIMCGYPRGKHSLDVKGEISGYRFSPLLQTGIISGFMPYDNAPLPYGIQTDIVSMGGSSGSPIVNVDDGNVVGIAQAVIPTPIEVEIKDEKTNETKTVYGSARMGLVYGTSNHVFHSMVNGVKRIRRGESPKFEADITGLKPPQITYLKL